MDGEWEPCRVLLRIVSVICVFLAVTTISYIWRTPTATV